MDAYSPAPALHFANATAPELLRLTERMRTWRERHPHLWRRFWSPSGVRCVLCHNVGDFLRTLPDGTGYLGLSVYTAPGSAARAALLSGGMDALLFHTPAPTSDEVYFGWCTRCQPPQTPEGWDAVVERVAATTRRALAPGGR